MAGIALETERLLLRQWREGDFEGFARCFMDPEHSKYIGGPCSRGQAWRKMATVVGHWTLRGFGIWAIEEKGSGKFAGAAGIWFPYGWPEIEVGYWLLPEMTGKGYATEAAGRSRDYAYNEMKLKTLISCIHPDNTASKRVAERLGAKQDGFVELPDYGSSCLYRHPSPSQA